MVVKIKKLGAIIVMTKRRTHSEYIVEANIIAPNIEIVGQYINNSTKIAHRCRLCGYEWNAMPRDVLRGIGCPECAKLKRAKSRTKTHEQYVAEVAIINKNIEVVGMYVNSNKKIEVGCKLCGHKWFTRAVDILSGCGCPKCACKARTKTHEQYISELATINQYVVAIEEYINCYTKIKHLCLKCGHEWSVKPHDLLSGNHCPQCSMRRKSHNQYVSELAIKNPDIEVVGEYINANTNIIHRCTSCGYEWMARPSHLLHGLGCPSCQETSGEQRIRQWLDGNCVKYEFQKRFADCKNERILPFDFYLSDYNCCIEYDGAQHFKEIDHWGGKEYLSRRQHNDQIKNDYCNKNNIRLIRIRYDEDVYDVLNNMLMPFIFSNAS